MQDLYQAVTDQIIAALEAGTKPWACAWDRSGGLPYNLSTAAPYQGINVLLLWMAAMRKGYGSSAWLTYKQAKAMGGQVRRGEKAVWGIFYKLREVRRRDAADEEARTVPVIKPFSVFNVEQIDGIEDPHAGKGAQFDPVERAEAVMRGSGAQILEGGPKAFYQPQVDVVRLPDRGRFQHAGDFYATGFHELTHWTGHKSRLARDLSGRFGTESYAAEELVAEIGAAFLMADVGLQGTVQDHASYLDSWLRVLKNDKRAIFHAAKLATQAHQFLAERAAGAPSDTEGAAA